IPLSIGRHSLSGAGVYCAAGGDRRTGAGQLLLRPRSACAGSFVGRNSPCAGRHRASHPVVFGRAEYGNHTDLWHGSRGVFLVGGGLYGGSAARHRSRPRIARGRRPDRERSGSARRGAEARPAPPAARLLGGRGGPVTTASTAGTAARSKLRE